MSSNASGSTSVETWPCPVCGSDRGLPVLRGRDTWRGGVEVFQVVRCPECTMLRTNPRPVAAALPGFFDGSYPFYRHAHEPASPDSGELERRLRPFIPRARRLTEIAGGPGRLLDAGCGDGYFMTAMKRLGWSVSGIERDAGTCAHARGLGHDVAECSFEELPTPVGVYDAITMWGVLQLSTDPVRTLSHASRLLRPGGILAIGVSNFASLDRRVFGGRWWGLGLPRHLCHFEPQTIRRLLKNCGCDVVKVLMDSPNWVAIENANTLLGIRGATDLPRRALRRMVVPTIRAAYFFTAGTRAAAVMEVYAAKPL